MMMLIAIVAAAQAEMNAGWSKAVPRVEGAPNYYVAPNGAPGNPGTREAPWDLESALASPHRVPPGGVIWVKGGTYSAAKGFHMKLSGAKGVPVHIRSIPGDHVLISSNVSVGSAAYAWLWDMEIASANSEGLSVNTCTDCKFVNLVIHDSKQGMGFWVGAIDSEVHGCIIFGNGYQGSDRHHGHCIYTQNKEGTKTISGCILSAKRERTGGSYTLHAYAQGNYVDNYVVQDNIAYEDGTFLVGGYKPSHNIKVSGNCLDGINMQMGYSAQNEDVELKNNVIVKGRLTIKKFSRVVEEGNLKDVAGLSKAFVFPNRFDSNRAYAAIYNAGKGPAATFGTGSFLKPGDSYRVLNPRDPWGKPLAEGRYSDGGVTVPMAGDFGAFVVLREPVKSGSRSAFSQK